MTAKVLAFYVMGGLLAIIGIVLGIWGGFDAGAWWTIGVGVVVALVGLLVQLGVLNPPEDK